MAALPRGRDGGTPQRRLAGTDLTLEDEGGRFRGDVVDERSEGRDFAVAAEQSVDLRPFHDRSAFVPTGASHRGVTP